MQRKILLSSLAVLGVSGCFAQGNFMMLDYSVAFPAGDLQEYTDIVNWRGFNLGYRSVPDDNVAIGFDLNNYLFFDEVTNALYTYENTSIFGTQFRYNNNTCMSAQVDYVMAPGADLRPYMGIGIGAMYVYRRTNFGIYQYNQDDWQFLIQPEAGISYYISDGTAFNLSANYFAGFDTKEMSGQRFLAANIGLIWSVD